MSSPAHTDRSRFERADFIAMSAVFAVALALRLLYLAQVWDLPFFEFPLVDARSYDEWGQAIAAGDWVGDRTFYQAPAYPYFLGVVYTIFGHDLLALHVVQMIMGAVSCVLLHAATHRLFGRTAALAAGLLLACYAPALFFDGLIQKTSLGLLLISCLMFAVTRFTSRPSTATALGCGALVGALALTRENALIFAAMIPAWIALFDRRVPRAQRATWSAGCVLGILLVLLPVGVRNYAVGGEFAVTTSQMGPNFYIGNNPNATGLYRPLLPGRHTPDFEGSDARHLAEQELARTLSPGEVSGFWMDRSLTWMREAPVDWLALLLYKALLTVNDFEVPDTEDVYVNAEFSWVLAGTLPFLRFGVLFPLAAAGIVIAWRERESRARDAAGLLAVLALVFAGAVAAFYVWARYRYPLVPLMLPFAGLAIARAIALLRRGDLEPLLAPAVALALTAALAHMPLLERERFQHTAWTNLGNIMIRHQRWEEAEHYLLRAASIHEDGADLQFHLGVLRMNQKQFTQAEYHLRKALAGAESDYRSHQLLFQVLRAQGRHEEARKHRRRAVELNPDRKRTRHDAPKTEPPAVEP